MFNNKLNLKDFEYVTKPYGDTVGELPAQMANRDILSSKIKAVLGIEARRPFNWKVVAVNPSATTRKEQAETEYLKQFVTNYLLKDLRLEIANEVMAQYGTAPVDQRQVKDQIEQQLATRTPREVKRYMRREHQDPAEVLGAQLLAYLTQRQTLADKFNKGCKHAALAAMEIYWVGEVNGEPTVRVVNPLFFDFDKSPDSQFIEDGEWAVCEYRMTPSEIINTFDDLTKTDHDLLYEVYAGGQHSEDRFTINSNDLSNHIRVLHVVWKALRKIGFLTYKAPNGTEATKFVNENYMFDPTAGDIRIEYKWIPEVHEGYKIADSIYSRMRPVPNQYKDLDNIYECKLPYIGAVYDWENSTPTSLFDRGRQYQYLYDIVNYRMEEALARDKGKKVIMNIAAVPDNLLLKQFDYHFDANSMVYVDLSKEGFKGTIAENDITRMLKEVDLSTTSDVSKYISILEYLDARCGAAIGVSKQLEAQIEEREAVGNVQRALSLSTNILETFYSTHDIVKRNTLQALLECAKVAYARGEPRKISYVLDDMSVASLTLDQELLDNNTLGIFVSNTAKSIDTIESQVQLAHAAMQTGQIPFSYIHAVQGASTPQEARGLLEEGEEVMQERQNQVKQAELQAQERMAQMQMQMQQAQQQFEIEKLKLEEELKYKREIAKQTILALGFNEEKDMNQNQEPDVIEVMKLLLQKRQLDIKDKEVGIKDKEADIKAKIAAKPKASA